MNDEMLTVQQAAERASCHPATIRRMIQRGELPALRVGSRWRVPAASLEAGYLQASATPRPAPEPAGRCAQIARELAERGARSDQA